jgi:hypothetical protein
VAEFYVVEAVVGGLNKRQSGFAFNGKPACCMENWTANLIVALVGRALDYRLQPRAPIYEQESPSVEGVMVLLCLLHC